jgi:hypothetical protein
MDSLAVSYAGEVARWGIETSIIVPGAFTKGTNHFAHSGRPADEVRAKEYAEDPTADIPDVTMKGLVKLEPADADPEAVAQAIVTVVNTPLRQATVPRSYRPGFGRRRDRQRRCRPSSRGAASPHRPGGRARAGGDYMTRGGAQGGGRRSLSANSADVVCSALEAAARQSSGKTPLLRPPTSLQSCFRQNRHATTRRISTGRFDFISCRVSSGSFRRYRRRTRRADARVQ